MTYHEKLNKIQQKFKAKKTRFNSFGKYNFRSAEDILEALKPFCDKYKVYFTVNEELQLGFTDVPVIKSTATMVDIENTDGLETENNSISASSIVGVDLNQKGMQTPQQFGTASSYAKKYALGNLLLIDDTADSDVTNTHSKSEWSSTKPERPKMSNTTLNSAKNYIKSGGKLEAIKNKYKMTPAQEQELITL